MRVINLSLVVSNEARTTLLLVSTVFSPHGWIAPQVSAPRAQAKRSGALAGVGSKALTSSSYGAKRRCLNGLEPG
jgi:hypothetical protein